MERVFLEYMGDSVELPIGETVIGRDVGCAMRFNDPSVSRRHLRFIRRQGEVFVEDLGSSNGTLLNGSSVGAARRIVDGDTVSVGTRLLTVRVLEDGDLDQMPATFVLAKLDMAPPKKSARGSSQIAVTQPPPLASAALVPAPLSHRRHDRLPIEMRLIYTSRELEVEAISRDLSESGVFICSNVLDPIGTECTLTLLVDGGPAFAIRGVVRRVVDRAERRGGQIGFGVEFLGVEPDQLAWIRMVVARMPADQTKPVDLT